MRPFSALLIFALLLWLASAPLSRGDATKGEEYFKDPEQGNCQSCHYPDSRRLVGPGLRGVTQRHSEEWLEMFLKDPQKTWESDHHETLDLKKRVRKTKVPITVCRKENMTEETYKNLMDYLKSLQD